MTERIALGDIVVDIERKNVRNIRLSVYPPMGGVKASAPLRMDIETIRVYVISKLDWIRRERRKFLDQDRELPREYVERESHYVWGRRYLLRVIEADAAPSVELEHSWIHLRVRPGADETKKRSVVDAWRRSLIREAVPPLLAKWEPVVGAFVVRFFVQRMKTKWGSCNFRASTIRLNSDLTRKPREFLEYVVVHEMAHLMEPTHNARFVAFMDRLMPHWKTFRNELNRLPVSYENWSQ